MDLAAALNTLRDDAGLLALVGALAGAFFAGIWTWWADRREEDAELFKLCELLAVELLTLPEPPPPFQEGKGYYRDPLGHRMHKLLLSSRSLRQPRDAALLEALVGWGISVDSHNDMIRFTNEAFLHRNLSEAQAREWHGLQVRAHETLLAGRAELLNELRFGYTSIIQVYSPAAEGR